MDVEIKKEDRKMVHYWRGEGKEVDRFRLSTLEST